jgi:hypothetical protein
LLGQAQLIERRLGKSAQATDRDRRAAGVVVNQAQRLDHLITTLLLRGARDHRPALRERGDPPEQYGCGSAHRRALCVAQQWLPLH